MQPCILFVDDDPDLLAAMQRSLRNEPWTCRFAGDAEQALAILAAEPVDVLVTDDRMPGLSGMDLLEAVRRDHPDTMAVMLTGAASVGLVVHAINDGRVLRFLLKPVRAEEVAAAVRHALAARRLQAGIREAIVLLRRMAGDTSSAAPSIRLADPAGVAAAADAVHDGLLRVRTG